MTKWDMTKGQTTSNNEVVATGQKITSMFGDDMDSVENRLSILEKKVDTLLNLLIKKKND
tara:strand:+ start:1124 stop:1303 length:180 start_codon:yes stop_codon:yes gene_type:complete